MSYPPIQTISINPLHIWPYFAPLGPLSSLEQPLGICTDQFSAGRDSVPQPDNLADGAAFGNEASR